MAEYISREAAINAIKAVPNGNWKSIRYAKEISAIPAADVAPIRHGRWKLHENGDGTCSECGNYQKHIWDLDHWQNFCGHCGAKMDLEG